MMATKALTSIAKLTQEAKTHMNRGDAFGRCGGGLATTGTEVKMYLAMLDIAQKAAATLQAATIRDLSAESAAVHAAAEAELQAAEARYAALQRQTNEQQAELQGERAKNLRLQHKSDAIARIMQE